MRELSVPTKRRSREYQTCPRGGRSKELERRSGSYRLSLRTDEGLLFPLGSNLKRSRGGRKKSVFASELGRCRTGAVDEATECTVHAGVPTLKQFCPSNKRTRPSIFQRGKLHFVRGESLHDSPFLDLQLLSTDLNAQCSSGTRFEKSSAGLKTWLCGVCRPCVCICVCSRTRRCFLTEYFRSWGPKSALFRTRTVIT